MGAVGTGLLVTGWSAAIVAAAGWWRARRVAARSDERARRLASEMDDILSGLGSGLLVVDGEGRVVRLNPAAGDLLGVPHADAPGRLLAEVGAEGLGPFRRIVQGVVDGGPPVHRNEVTIRTADGRELPLGVTVTPLPGEDRRAPGAVAVFRDLTEVHRLRRRMREADRMATIGELSAGIAHEIRNPLGSIRGCAELLASESSVTGQERELLELILRESERVNRLMDDFLSFARVRAPRHEPIALRDLGEELSAALAMHPQVADGVEMTVTVEPADLVVPADRDQLRQVLWNLLLNAAQAVGESGHVRLQARPDDDGRGCRIEVVDDGPGVPPEHRERIFDPFVTSKPAGTGLGLSVARRIARAHDGDLVCLEAPGGGTLMRLVLPLEPSRETAPLPGEEAVAAKARSTVLSV